MNIFKQWYLRLFKGYHKMGKVDSNIVKVFFMYSDKKPEFIYLGNNKFLVSPPK